MMKRRMTRIHEEEQDFPTMLVEEKKEGKNSQVLEACSYISRICLDRENGEV